MSTIKSSNEDITINADGSGRSVKFQANGVEKASISSAGTFTSTSIDATKLSGALPAIDGSALTGVGNAPAFMVIPAAAGDSIALSTWEKVLWDGTETFDTDSAVVNGTFTPQVAGKYFLSAQVAFSQIDSDNHNQIAIYKNGTNLHQVRFYPHNPGGTGPGNISGMTINHSVEANGTTDYFEIYVYQNSGTRLVLGSDTMKSSYFTGFKLAGV